MPTSSFTPVSTGNTVKFYGIVDNISLGSSLKLPTSFANKFILHRFSGDYPHKDIIHEWVKSERFSARSSLMLEFRKSHARNENERVMGLFIGFVYVLRFVKYNRAFLSHVVIVDKKKVSSWTTNIDIRPTIPWGPIGKAEKIAESSLRKARKLYKLLGRVSKQKNKRVYRAFYFWSQSSGAYRFEGKILYLFAALEALFSVGERGEITYKLANRMAWFVEKSNRARRFKLFETIINGYKIRSRVIHGGGFVESNDMPVIQEIHSLTRKIILSILQNKKLFEIYSLKKEDGLRLYFKKTVMGIQTTRG